METYECSFIRLIFYTLFKNEENIFVLQKAIKFLYFNEKILTS